MSAPSDALYPLLDALSAPGDVVDMDADGLRALADELRHFIIDSVTRTGGHLGAGLGVVELTLALFAEYEFNDRDKLVWDVGHQCYPHKLLTGRRERFATLRQWEGLSGFPDPAESPFDTVKTGHGGTSISTAMGFALPWRGREADAGRKAVAVIGDGSLQEGNAFEALNHGGSYRDLELVVVLDDNNMSISPSVGALSAYLSRARSSTWLNQRLRTIQGAIRRIPGIGDEVDDVLLRWYHSLQGIIPHHALGIIFEELGFFYYGPIDGHDIDALRTAFRATRWMRRPVLIHAVTSKGRGYKDDVPEATCYHAASGSHPPAAAAAAEYPDQGGPTFTAAFAAHATTLLERDPRVTVLTAAMLDGTGLTKVQAQFPERVLDVGMAEQHAVALAAGLALAGQRPIAAIYSTFLQRASISSSRKWRCRRRRCCSASIAAASSATTARPTTASSTLLYLRCLPNFVLMAPRDTGELAAMMDLALTVDGPTAIRFPRGSGATPDAQLPHAPFAVGEAERVADGRDGCLLAYGPMVYTALAVRHRILATTGRTLAVVNARFAKPLDERLIAAELAAQPVMFTLEDHVAAGGFGAAVLELASGRADLDANRVEVLALPDRFIDHGQRGEQLASAGLDLDHVVERVNARLAALRPGPPVRLVTGS